MTAPWVDEPWISLDTETTGVDVWRDRVVQVAVVTITPDGELVDPWCTLVDPGVDIPEGATAIHGITTERARAEGIPTPDAVTAVAERVFAHGHRPVCIMNGRFDWAILASEAERHDLEFPYLAPVLDPLVIDRMIDPDRRGSRKLVDLCAHYGVELSAEDAHDALADCVAAVRVMRALLVAHPKITERSLSSVFLRQGRGFERWRAGFVDWCRINRDPGFDIEPGWPIPANGVPAPLQLVKGSGEAGDREAPAGGDTVHTSPDVPLVPAAGEGSGSSVPGPTGEVAADLSHGPAATKPALSVKDVGRLGSTVFRPMVGDERGVTARVERLRHALTLATTGSKRSLAECDDRDLRRVHSRLRDMQEGRLLVEVDDDGVSFEMRDGPGVTVLWSQLEDRAVVA